MASRQLGWTIGRRRPIISPSAPALAPEHSPMPRLEQIHLADLWPSSVEPVRLYASFDALGDLLTAQAPDLDLEWMRYPDETGEKFSRRIANDLLATRGRPPLPEPLPSVVELHAHAMPRPVEIVDNGWHGARHGHSSKLIEEGFKEQPRPHKPRPQHYKPRVKALATAE